MTLQKPDKRSVSLSESGIVCLCFPRGVISGVPAECPSSRRPHPTPRGQGLGVGWGTDTHTGCLCWPVSVCRLRGSLPWEIRVRWCPPPPYTQTHTHANHRTDGRRWEKHTCSYSDHMPYAHPRNHYPLRVHTHTLHHHPVIVPALLAYWTDSNTILLHLCVQSKVRFQYHFNHRTALNNWKSHISSNPLSLCPHRSTCESERTKVACLDQPDHMRPCGALP